jgi:hypothetical protein
MRICVATQIQGARQVWRAGRQFAPTLIIAQGTGCHRVTAVLMTRNESTVTPGLSLVNAPIGQYIRLRIAVPAARTAVSSDLIAANTQPFEKGPAVRDKNSSR